MGISTDSDRKREMALPPGTFAFVLDGTKGSIRTHVGPTTLTLTQQEKPVRFKARDGSSNQSKAEMHFEECSIEEAVQHNVVAPEGFYVELLNPAVNTKAQGGPTAQYPEIGRVNDTPDFLTGEKVNIAGPISFALYPGQMAEVRRGHHLRLNEFLRIKIYNDDKARNNWSKAVVKKAEGGEPTAAPIATKQPPTDIALGKQYNIEGKDVSFYIPPTGVSVVPEPETGDFVRSAETLEQLEYSILVDEDGNKEYPRGPAVVFPKPTQKFLKDKAGNRKFRAVELNELQGIQLKFTKETKLTFANGDKKKFSAGEEGFITGKEMPIYFPEEGHQLVRYDGKSVHYALAVPEGEARYVMNRKTGEIETVKGPCMLLPNPVTHIIVRRALSDWESITMFPGPDGKGSPEALEYNRWLRGLAAQESTTRQGVVGEGSVERLGNPAAAGGVFSNAPMGDFSTVNMSYSTGAVGNAMSGFDAIESAAQALSTAAQERGVSTRGMRKSAAMSESRQGKQQEAMVGDVAERKSTFHEPRMLTMANRHKGVPPIKVRQGYAVQIVDSDGGRRVEVGPKTILLEYAETLDALGLSTGKPKTTDKLFYTAYLNISNNKITDVVEVETIDHVRVKVKVVYNLNFEGDKAKWFAIENFVKYMCDHARSILKNRAKKVTVEQFYSNATDLIREYILETKSQSADVESGKPTAARTGMFFPENGMRVTDVEVLAVDIADEALSRLFGTQQREVVEQNIKLLQAKKKLEITQATEEIKRKEADTVADTERARIARDKELLDQRTALAIAEVDAEIKRTQEQEVKKKVEEGIKDFVAAKELERQVLSWKAEDERAREKQAQMLAEIKARTEAIVAQMTAVSNDLVAALQQASASGTLVEVAKSLSFHAMFGGENAVDVIRKVFAGTPLEAVMLKAISSATGVNGSALTQAIGPRAGA